jgi:arylsulfatase A-like enzyme
MARKPSKTTFIGSLIPLVVVSVGYLLWPLKSDEWAIDWDIQAISQKEQILNEIKVLDDSISKPNIILIVADDLGKYDFSLYGHPQVKTPNIDQIAKNGVRFEQAYVSASVCAPSRAGLLTGRYQHRFGFENQTQERYLKNRIEYHGMNLFVNSDPWEIRFMESVPDDEAMSKQGLPPSEITLAELLKQVGYSTALIGKWHLGKAEGQTPCDFGFDYQYGFYGSHSLFIPEGTEGYVDQKIEDDWTDKYIWKGQREGVYAIRRNCSIIDEPRYITDAIAEESIEFVQSHNDGPFFLYLPFSAPHTPLQASKEDLALFAGEEDPVKRTYYAMIVALDRAIGKIMRSLQEQNEMGNTLIFFLSDNGGATYTHTTDNGPLKGGKITAFEGGLQVPFLMQWKGKIPSGQQQNTPVTSLDIFTTCAKAAGIKLPVVRKFDGTDLYALVDSTNHDYSKRTLHWKRGSIRCILDYPHKLIFDDSYGQEILYNLEEDPFEKFNIATGNPNLVSQLKSKQATWEQQMPDPLWPPLITFKHEDDDQIYYFDN